MPEWVSIKEAAELTGHSKQYLQRIVRQGKLKAEKPKGLREWLVDKKSLLDYVRLMKTLGNEKYNPRRDE
jgi:excisionase family DNA binding protein